MKTLILKLLISLSYIATAQYTMIEYNLSVDSKLIPCLDDICTQTSNDWSRAIYNYTSSFNSKLFISGNYHLTNKIAQEFIRESTFFTDTSLLVVSVQKVRDKPYNVYNVVCEYKGQKGLLIFTGINEKIPKN